MGRKRKGSLQPKPRGEFAKKYGEFPDGEKAEKVVESKFREWLAEFIKENKLHNRDVGELFGINDSLFGHYLKGIRLLTYTTLVRIKAATGVTFRLFPQSAMKLSEKY